MGALGNHEEVVAARLTEMRIFGNGVLTFRAFDRVGGLGSRLQVLRVHGGHHETEPHSETCACLTGVLRGAFHRHGCLHLEKPVEVVEHGEFALVVDGLLDLLGRGDRSDVKAGELDAEEGESFSSTSVSPADIASYCPTAG